MRKLLSIPQVSSHLDVYEREIIAGGERSYEYHWQITLTKMGYDFRYNPGHEVINSDDFERFINGFRQAILKYHEMLKSEEPPKASHYVSHSPAIKVTKYLPQRINKYPGSSELVEYQPKCIAMKLSSSTNSFAAEYTVGECEAIVKELEQVPHMVDIMIKKLTLLRTEFPET